MKLNCSDVNYENCFRKAVLSPAEWAADLRDEIELLRREL